MTVLLPQWKITNYVMHKKLVGDCRHSKQECLQALSNFLGRKPILLSYEVPQVQYSVHPITGMNLSVPNIVHLISFGDKQPFVFYNYVLYKSIAKYIKPHVIVLWADTLPAENNTWWQKTLQQVPNIYFIYTKPYDVIAGQKIHFIEHASDLLRLEILRGMYSEEKAMSYLYKNLYLVLNPYHNVMKLSQNSYFTEFGGIYFDNDVIVLKSFDDMRIHQIAMGRAMPSAISNGIIVCVLAYLLVFI